MQIDAITNVQLDFLDYKNSFFFGEIFYFIFIFHVGWLICVKWRDNWERWKKVGGDFESSSELCIIHSRCAVGVFDWALSHILTVRQTNWPHDFFYFDFLKFVCWLGDFHPKISRNICLFFFSGQKKNVFKLEADPVRLAGGWPRRAMRMPFFDSGK